MFCAVVFDFISAEIRRVMANRQLLSLQGANQRSHASKKVWDLRKAKGVGSPNPFTWESYQKQRSGEHMFRELRAHLWGNFCRFQSSERKSEAGYIQVVIVDDILLLPFCLLSAFIRHQAWEHTMLLHTSLLLYTSWNSPKGWNKEKQ